MTRAEKRWWKRHGQEIIDTMAGDSGPDVVALLHDETTYSVIGDHGSASENDQRIPIVFWQAGMKPGRSGGTMRNVDITPTILKAMGIRETAHTDGKARSIGH
jgi:arylsulfatase A-like enzyme